LRCIAMSVWASIFEEGTPIPFLGLEAAASGTLSIADGLLENALRMISLDAYRMATIVDAYASCAKALQVRLVLDRKSPDISWRQKKMKDELGNALTGLKNVVQQRTESGKKAAAQLERPVKNFIEALQTRAEAIHRSLPG
jgi:hypothetical protein